MLFWFHTTSPGLLPKPPERFLKGKTRLPSSPREDSSSTFMVNSKPRSHGFPLPICFQPPYILSPQAPSLLFPIRILKLTAHKKLRAEHTGSLLHMDSSSNYRGKGRKQDWLEIKHCWTRNRNLTQHFREFERKLLELRCKIHVHPLCLQVIGDSSEVGLIWQEALLVEAISLQRMET